MLVQHQALAESSSSSEETPGKVQSGLHQTETAWKESVVLQSPSPIS